ncbi:MAG: sodium/proton-translocating pyrophosphatase, partial [Owenweeksia sp.]
PLVVGFVLGKEALAGLLIGATSSGFVLAVMMANAGGAWDNAKKSFEAGVEIDGKMEYKGSDAHKASVTGDTVGDPFKDTSGPSMNILIKLMSIVSLVIAPHIQAGEGMAHGHAATAGENMVATASNYVFEANEGMVTLFKPNEESITVNVRAAEFQGNDEGNIQNAAINLDPSKLEGFVGKAPGNAVYVYVNEMKHNERDNSYSGSGSLQMDRNSQIPVRVRLSLKGKNYFDAQVKLVME